MSPILSLSSSLSVGHATPAHDTCTLKHKELSTPLNPPQPSPTPLACRAAGKADKELPVPEGEESPLEDEVRASADLMFTEYLKGRCCFNCNLPRCARPAVEACVHACAPRAAFVCPRGCFVALVESPWCQRMVACSG